MRGVTITVDDSGKIARAVEVLTKKQVLVGVPQAKTPRKPEPGEPSDITNAAIGYINEFGSPARNIPARAHLIPGVEKVLPQAEKYLVQAAEAALAGDAALMLKCFHAAGITAETGVKAKIRTGPFEPLAEATLANRRRRGRTGEKPLQDTGQYRNSITHVVRDKGA